jgi:outer membrane protein OmpA-like peptidoglycan-associated protein
MSEQDNKDISTKVPTYYQINKERIYEKKKLWILKNKDKVREANKRWREKNKEKIAKQKSEYNKIGYYKSKLIQKFNIMKNEIIIGNDSKELLEEFKELLDEMVKLDLIDQDEYSNLIALV